MQAEIDFRIDGWLPPAGVAVRDEVPDEGEVEHAVEVPIEAILGDIRLNGNEHGTIEVSRLRWPEHRSPPVTIPALPAV